MWTVRSNICIGLTTWANHLSKQRSLVVTDVIVYISVIETPQVSRVYAVPAALWHTT